MATKNQDGVISSALRQCCKTSPLTSRAIAKRIGVSPTTIWRFTARQGGIDMPVADLLGDLFGLAIALPENSASLTLSESLREAVRKRGIVLASIAAQSSLSAGTIYRFMNKGGSLSLQSADQLVRLLGLQVIQARPRKDLVIVPNNPLPFRLSFALPQPLRDRLIKLLAGPLDTPCKVVRGHVSCDIDEIAAIHLLAVSARLRGHLGEKQARSILAACNAATSAGCDSLDDLLRS